MCPPLDVPSAPPRSSTDSSAMPSPRIAVLSEAVLVPGSPEASVGSGRGSPSVCSTSYLGIRQPVTATPAVGGRGRHFHGPNSRVPVATRFEQDCRVCSKTLGRPGSRKPPVNPAAFGPIPSAVRNCPPARLPYLTCVFRQTRAPGRTPCTRRRRLRSGRRSSGSRARTNRTPTGGSTSSRKYTWPCGEASRHLMEDARCGRGCTAWRTTLPYRK
jgi:hypothetical protein